MNKAHTEILKVKPIRFYPSASGSESGESMATVWNDCHGENGIRFHPPIHMVADANQNRQAIKDGENLLGPVEEGVEIKNADLVGHDPLHECDHVRLIAISYFFSKE